MADMAQVQEQSRKSFFQWHILLIMKKQQLQRTLSDAGVRPDMIREIDEQQAPVVDSDELALLERFGLPIPQDLTEFDLPDRETVAGIRFFFRAAPALDNENDFVLDFIRQLVDGGYERCEFIRVQYDDRRYLRKAAEKLNQALTGYATSMVFNAAKVWSSFHTAVVMDWEAVSARLLGVETTTGNADWYLNLADPGEEHEPQKKTRRIDINGRKSLFGDE